MSAKQAPLDAEAIRRFNGPPADALETFFPFIRTLRGYERWYFRRDLIAGLTVALFTIPQGMAYALIAGFPPSAGIYTAVVASILGAAFGSSEYLINGPTNAIAVMIASNVSLFAANGDAIHAIILLTLMIGLLQVFAGVVRMGSLTRFVSESVLIGFTAGAGLFIVINQLPAFLGIESSAIAKDLWGYEPPKAAIFDLLRLLRSLEHTHFTTMGLALGTLFLVRLLQRLDARIGRKLPAPFIAVLVIGVVAWALGFSIEDTPNKVKAVRDIEPLTRELPALALPHITYDGLRALFGAACAIALMGSVEAIAIGKTLAARAGHSFDASKQLVGEGLCNIGAAAVGGFASSGSFSRTAVNYEAGAITRMSCIYSGVLVLVVVFAFAPAANLIPIAALAGTLVHIGLKLVDVARMKAIFETTTGDRAVLIATFSGVLLVEHLENALLIGVAVSIFYALRRAEGFKLRVLDVAMDGGIHESDDARPGRLLPREESEEGTLPPEVTLLNLQGELYFAAAEELQTELKRVLAAAGEKPRFLVLRVQEAYNLDITTADALAHIADEARARGGRLILCGVRPGMYGTLERAGLISRIGGDAILPAEPEVLASTRKAIALALTLAEERRRALGEHEEGPPKYEPLKLALEEISARSLPPPPRRPS